MQVCNSPTNSPNRRGALPRGIPLHAVGQLVDSHLLSHIPSPSKREGDVDREGREQVSLYQQLIGKRITAAGKEVECEALPIKAENQEVELQ